MIERQQIWDKLKRNKSKLLSIAVLLIILPTIQNCTLKQPGKETPAPYEERFPKSFFVEFSEVEGQAVIKNNKDFLCGWAAHRSAGIYGRYLQHSYPTAWTGCNIRFFIEEDYVVGKSIHNSHLNDEDRWKDIVRIPIINHHYYEKSKDGRGRETNTFVENSARSHWSARPFMKLDLKNVEVMDPEMAPLFGASKSPSQLSDVVKDFEGGFLAFSVIAQSAEYGAKLQGKFRFNFMRYQHDRSFKTTPYHDENSKYVAPVLITGHRNGYSEPKMVVPKWDVRKVQVVHLMNFPKEYEHLGFEAIKEWNDVFSSKPMNNGRPFKAVLAPNSREYPFDLRYPTINWIEDSTLNGSRGLLGIAGQLSDLRNGKIIWGSVNMYGDNIRNYINKTIPQVSSVGMSMESKDSLFQHDIQLGLMEAKTATPDPTPIIPKEMTFVDSVADVKTRIRNSLGMAAGGIEIQAKILESGDKEAIQKMLNAGNFGNYALGGKQGEAYFNPAKDLYQSSIDRDGRPRLSQADILAPLKKSLAEYAKVLSGQSRVTDNMAQDYISLSAELRNLSTRYKSRSEIYNGDMLQKMMGQPSLESSLEKLTQLDEFKGKLTKSATPMEIMNSLTSLEDMNSQKLAALHMEQSGHSRVSGWLKALDANYLSPLKAEKKAMKFTLLHEIGHMIGMHHNFKENILPEKGHIPNDYRNTLVKNNKDFGGTFHTVMGYPDGLTEMMTPYDKILPGIGDKLVLNYIYNSKYPTYPKNSNGDQKIFNFVTLKENGDGRFRDTETHRIAFLPHCFIAAYTGDDPYCKPRDRGSDAFSIVKNHFSNYAGTLSGSLFSFSDATGGNYKRREQILWWRSLTTFGAVRLFYDYMRQKYASEIKSFLKSGGEQAAQNLIDFAQTCENVYDGKPVTNQIVAEVLRKPENKELLSLCRATAFMIDELKFYMTLQGRDYTELVYRDKYYSNPIREGDTAGDKTYMARSYGKWTNLSRFPIKISALLALTSPYPFMMGRGWVIPVHQFAREDGAYHISTLYAQKFAKAISSATEMNLSIGDDDLGELTSISKTIMSLGYFLNNTWRSNDVLTSYKPFIQNIRNQTKYRYSLAFIEVERKDDDKGNEVANKFSASIHNIYDKGPENIPEIYMFTNDRVVIMPPPRSMILPRSSIRWYSENKGYFLAYKLDYESGFYDRLQATSVRQIFKEMYYNTMKSCVQGEGNGRNGLRYYFNANIPEFKGFEFPSNIHDGGDTAKNKFFESLELEFLRYYRDNPRNFSPAPKASTCEEAIRGQGLIVMAASAINGLYFPDIFDYIQKGYAW